MSLAFVFPGQGSQQVGMGKALCEVYPEARAVFEAADDALGVHLSRLCFQGPEDQLALTANTQPAILTTSVAAHAVVSARCSSAPLLVAGHSLGEYSALVAVGALSVGEAVRVVRARGVMMQEAVAPGAGAMAAVLGLDAERVGQICEESAQGEVVAPANYNEPLQTVIAGTAAAVRRASERLKAAGAKRVLPLPVSAPFHCALMQPVVPRLAAELATVAFRTPTAPVVTNVEATPNADPTRMASLLVRQVTAPVRWTECVRALKAGGVSRVVELGPGRVLSGLIRRICPELECVSVSDADSLSQVLAA